MAWSSFTIFVENTTSRERGTVLIRIRFPYVEIGSVIKAPSHAVWNLLVDTSRWAEWGPSIREVIFVDRILTPQASGHIRTTLGFSASFTVTHFEPGRAWSWRIFNIPATTHRVEDIGKGLSCLYFGVPMIAFPYLIVCLVAIRRIVRLCE